MKIKFEGRWTTEQLIGHLVGVLRDLDHDNAVKYWSGVNLNTVTETEDKEKLILVDEDDKPVILTIRNPYSDENKKSRKRTPKQLCEIVDINSARPK